MKWIRKNRYGVQFLFYCWPDLPSTRFSLLQWRNRKYYLYTDRDFKTLRQILLTILTAFSITSATFSQERKIVGRALDHATQKPIKNVNVGIPGTTSETFTNHAGFFELTLDAAKYKSLIVSHIGYKTYEVPVPKEDKFKFFLDKEIIVLKGMNLSLYPRKQTHERRLIQNPLPVQDDIYYSAQSEAMFVGGIEDFYTHLGNTLVTELSQVDGKGFNIFFTINEAGKAVDVSVSDSSRQIKNTVAQAFQKMPDWTPAKQKQNNVPQHFELSVIKLNIQDIIATDLKDFYDFVAEKIKYPLQTRRMGIEGAVFIEFHLDDKGAIILTKVVKGISDECNTEVRRVLTMMPVALTKSLSDKINHQKFILPVFFGLGRPFNNKRFDPAAQPLYFAESLMLKEIDVIADE